MSSPCQIEVLTPAAWSAVARSCADLNYRQVVEFSAACATRVGAQAECVRIRDAGGTTIGLAHVRLKRLPLLGGIAYINGGPLVRSGSQAEPMLRNSLRALRQHYVKRGGMTLRVAPAIGSTEWHATLARVFAEEGFGPAGLGDAYRTIVLDLRPPVEQIRRRLEQKWRNCLNRAEKNGLTVRDGDAPELFEAFCTLYDDLRDRKEFHVELDARFYADVQRRLPAQERFAVTLVEFQGVPVAGHVGSELGDTAVYLLGATNRAGLEQKASYLMQWHVLQRARLRGCTAYDLGGIDPETNPGVYHFKCGMGGEDVTCPGPFEAQASGFRSMAVRQAERLYRWLRSRGPALKQAKLVTPPVAVEPRNPAHSSNQPPSGEPAQLVNSPVESKHETARSR